MNSISVDQLKTEHARLIEARKQLHLNVVAHDGALQAIEQLILLAERPAKQPPAPLATGGEGGQRDAPAEEQPGASQKA